VAVHVDAAQRALLAAVPTSRDPGVPLAQALVAFAEELEDAARAMPAWRDEAAAGMWESCSKALEDARVRADELRLEGADLGFEALTLRVGDLLHPLEAFADAETHLRRRR